MPSDAAGERLDRFLASLAAVGTRAAAERLLQAGRVLVDGVPRPRSYRVTAGQSVVFEQAAAPVSREPEPHDIAVVFEDEHLLVVDKPAGVVVHPGAGHVTGTLAQAALQRGAAGGMPERPGIVHRLDRDTSGLLVIARSELAHRRLQSLVRRRIVEREYLVLVAGRPRSRRGQIEAPIGRDRHDPTRQSLDTGSPRDAVTHFEISELLPEHTLLRVWLETGRTHQIRVHLAAIELPVVGDRLYGVAGLSLDRQFLHATRLAFPHPFTGEHFDVSSPLPPDLRVALERARAGT